MQLRVPSRTAMKRSLPSPFLVKSGSKQDILNAVNQPHDKQAADMVVHVQSIVAPLGAAQCRDMQTLSASATENTVAKCTLANPRWARFPGSSLECIVYQYCTVVIRTLVVQITKGITLGLIFTTS